MGLESILHLFLRLHDKLFGQLFRSETALVENDQLNLTWNQLGGIMVCLSRFCICLVSKQSSLLNIKTGFSFGTVEIVRFYVY